MIIYPDGHPKDVKIWKVKMPSTERRIFYIDVGKLPAARAQEYLEFVKQQVKDRDVNHLP